MTELKMVLFEIHEEERKHEEKKKTAQNTK